MGPTGSRITGARTPPEPSRSGLTWIDRVEVVLDDGDHPDARHHSYTDQLQADVQPLHGGVAKEQAALVLLQTPGDLLLKPGTTKISPLVSNIKCSIKRAS